MPPKVSDADERRSSRPDPRNLNVKIISVAGARPNFMKIAPLMEAFGNRSEIDPMLVHTGQHYDEKMSDLVFLQLGIPEPDIKQRAELCLLTAISNET